MQTVDYIVHNAKEIITLKGDNKARSGKAMNELSIMKNSAMAIKDGIIINIDNTDTIKQNYLPLQWIDAENTIICPGFVDPHTHPVFVHTRENEFEMRLQGKSYVEISKAGGGILSSINAVREADEDYLFELAYNRINRMIECGTTAIEAKSGYGLSTESELKMLKVIKKLQEFMPIEIVSTFMGAHEFPLEYRNNRQAYIDLLINEMMPEVKRQNLAEYVDIFTEAHVYNIEESRKILLKAKELGFKIRMHADEIEAIGGAELAAEMGAVSADHLGACSDEGIKAMRDAGVIATLLPGTLFSLRSKSYARAKDMISAGLPVAIASDYNPGSCNLDSMQFAMTLSCLQMGMTPAEALTAATFNAACAIERQDFFGSLEKDKNADFVMLDIPSIAFIPYHFGSNNVSKVYKLGELIFSRD
ncbi:MAG: imidazolonepropionase [Candidatus Cloacimonetes bacterium]|jgi:imidazolonepropionase|nr:imidazolonepropionase [Candidatus Cloacimonadota bacterium]MDD4156420.1 imidazolonepropionase [Candidatus Cloacimonadota bacterium]